MQLENVDPRLLKPNPWNSNIVSPENEEKLEQSIDRLGMFKPVVVRTLGDGTLQILGGEHRAEVASNKGVETIPVINLGVIDDVKAKEISLVDNGRYGTDDTLKLAELMEDLGGADILSTFTPFSDAELNAIFSSKSIDFDDLGIDDTDMPALDDVPTSPSKPTTPDSQIMRFKVAVEDAGDLTDVINYIMKTQNFNASDALTNAGDALVYMAGKYRELISGAV